MKNITKWKNLTIEQRLQKDYCFGKSGYRKLKKICASLLKATKNVWVDKEKLITQEDYEQRSLKTAFAHAGIVMLENLKKAKKFREESRMRHCSYTMGRYEKEYVYILHFYKLSEAKYKNNYLYVNKIDVPKTKSKFSRKEPTVKLEKIIESGRFIYRPIFFTEFNLHLKPKKGQNYSLKVYGKNLEKSMVYRFN